MPFTFQFSRVGLEADSKPSDVSLIDLFHGPIRFPGPFDASEALLND